MGGNQSSQRKPTHARGEHTNSHFGFCTASIGQRVKLLLLDFGQFTHVSRDTLQTLCQF